MNFYAFTGLVNGLAATVLGLYIYTRAVGDSRRYTYGLYCLSLSVWSYFYCAWHLATSEAQALLYLRLLMSGAILIPIFYFHHTVTILGLVDQTRSWLRIGYGLSGLFLAADCTSLFVAEVRPELSFPYWPKPGPLFHPYLLYLVVYVSYATYLMYRAMVDAKGLRRTQYLYLMLGAIVGYTGGATNFPLWYGIQLPPYGNALVAVYAAIVAYTIVRYRVFDFAVAMEKGLAFLFLLLFMGLPAYLLLEIAQEHYFGAVHVEFSILLLCLLTLVVSIAYKLKTGTEEAIGRTLFRHRYDMYDTLSQFSRSLVTILDLRSLTQEIVETLARVVGINTASLYLLDKEKDAYLAVSSHGVDLEQLKAIRFSTRDVLPISLLVGQPAVLREELEHDPGAHGLKAILEALVELDAEVCIPLINKDRLIGFCNLGHRRNHQAYSPDDLNLLTTLAQNAAIALDNASLYEELKRSQVLMRRTDRLRSLETIAGGFAHEIRNPLTSIKTFIQLAPERKDDVDFMGYFSKVVSEDVDRIERLIQEILDYARYMEPKLSEEDINDIVSSCLYFVEVKATSKAITIEKDLAPGLPPLLVDRQQIKQVLLNLFLNAMDAMSERGGRLVVRTHRLSKSSGEPWIQVEVSDTGSGISTEHLEHIFDPFYTTKHESDEREGTGLGLTIVHQIVREHRGYIEVESQVGKGTTFYVNFPCNPTQAPHPHTQVDHEETRPLSRR